MKWSTSHFYRHYLIWSSLTHWLVKHILQRHWDLKYVFLAHSQMFIISPYYLCIFHNSMSHKQWVSPPTVTWEKFSTKSIKWDMSCIIWVKMFSISFGHQRKGDFIGALECPKSNWLFLYLGNFVFNFKILHTHWRKKI